MGFRSHHQIGSSPEEASAGFASSGGGSSEHAAVVRTMAQVPAIDIKAQHPRIEQVDFFDITPKGNFDVVGLQWF